MKLYNNIWITLLSYSIVSYLNGFLALNYIDPEYSGDPLPDVGFQYLPHISPNYPNNMLIVYCLYFVLRFVRFKNIEHLKNLLWSITLLFALRAFTFTLTIVPPSTVNCYYRNKDMPIQWNVLQSLLTSSDNTCIDYMFSGHAVYFLLLCLSVIKFSQNKYEKFVNILYVTLGILSIIAGHIHYTVDVLIAIVLSVGTSNLLF